MKKILFSTVLGLGIVWASPLSKGKNLFQNNCASCHGIKAQGKIGPALNGTGHSAHHSPMSMMQKIKKGGKIMPSFKGKLKDEEIMYILKYLKSTWPKNVQKHYNKKFGNGMMGKGMKGMKHMDMKMGEHMHKHKD